MTLVRSQRLMLLSAATLASNDHGGRASSIFILFLIACDMAPLWLLVGWTMGVRTAVASCGHFPSGRTLRSESNATLMTPAATYASSEEEDDDTEFTTGPHTPDAPAVAPFSEGQDASEVLLRP